MPRIERALAPPPGGGKGTVTPVQVANSQRRLVAVLVICVAALAAQSASAQDSGNGQKIFRSQCSICHSAQPGRTVVGPSLFGVVGRHSGSVPGFHYSDANRESGLVWDPSTLDRYLTSPRQVVPGTLMTFPGLRDPAQRADVIAFLEGLH